MLRGFPIDEQSKERYTAWINYFTLPSEFIKVDQPKISSMDSLLSHFHYEPKTIKEIKESIENMQTSQEIESILKDLFNFQSFHLFDYLTVCKLALEQPNKNEIIQNSNLIPHFIMRGFIILSSRMADIVNEYLNRRENEHYSFKIWSMIQYPILYLLNKDHNLYLDTIKCIDPFLSAFSQNQSILGFIKRLSIDSFEMYSDPFITGYLGLVAIFTQNISDEFDVTQTDKLFTFVVDLYRYIVKYSITDDLEKNKTNNKYLQNLTYLLQTSHAFINNITFAVKKMNLDQFSLLFDFCLNYISNRTLFLYDSPLRVVYFTVDCIKLLIQTQYNQPKTSFLLNSTQILNADNANSKLNSQLKSSLLVSTNIKGVITNQVVMHSIVLFLLWLTDSFSITDLEMPLVDDIFNQDQFNDIHFRTKEEYLSEIHGIPSHLTFKTKSEEVEIILSELRSLFIEFQNFLMIFLSSILNEINQQSQIDNKIKICICIYRSLFGIKSIQQSSELYNFLLQTFLDETFPMPPQQKGIIDHPNQLLNESQIKPESCDQKYLKEIKSNEKKMIRDFETYFELGKLYQNVYISFLYRTILQSDSHLKLILRVISAIISTKGFPYTWYFLPLFQSSLMIDEKIHFVSAFLTSEIYEGSQMSFTNQEFITLVNSLLSFYQLMILTNPIDAFASFPFISVIKTSLTIQRFQSIMIPCIKIGIQAAIKDANDNNNSNSNLMILKDKALTNIVDHILFILCDSQIILDNFELSIKLLSIITEYLSLFPDYFINKMSNNGFFIMISQLYQMPLDSLTAENKQNVFHTVLLFFIVLCNKYSGLIQKLHSMSIFRELYLFSKIIILNDQIINDLLCFTLNILPKNVFIQIKTNDVNKLKKYSISNSYAMKLMLNICRNCLEYEEILLRFLLFLCKTSLTNCLICFTSDLIGYIVGRLKIDQLCDVSLDLLKTIGSKFFSPLVLNHIFTSMRLNKDEKHPKFLNKLLHIFLSMILTDEISPVTSYFHFQGEPQNGIFVDEIEPTIPFTFVTTFRLESNDSPSTLFALHTENGINIFSLYISNREMHINQSLTEDDKSIHPINVRFNDIMKLNTWYKIYVLFFSTNCVQVILNHESKSNILPIKTLNFESKMKLTIGTMKYIKSNHLNSDHDKRHICDTLNCQSFVGDIGPIFMITTTNLEEIEEIDTQFSSFRRINIYFFVNIFPWNVSNKNDGGDILVIKNIDKNDKNGCLIGNAIPYASTITHVFQFNGIFEQFLPLFLLLNYDGEIEDTRNDKIDLFTTLLLILEQMLVLSEVNRTNFLKIGGFKLLSGIFFQIDSTLFDHSVIAHLESIFEHVNNDDIKLQITQSLWLNFDLWFRMNYEVQKSLFTDILYSIWTEDMMNINSKTAFKLTSLEFLLYMIQKSRNDYPRYPLLQFPETRQNAASLTKNDNETNNPGNSLLLANNAESDENTGNHQSLNLITSQNTNKANDSLLSNHQAENNNSKVVKENVINQLSQSEEFDIKRYAWKFFSDLLGQNSSSSAFVAVFVILLGHKDPNIKELALNIIEHYLSQNDQNLLIGIDLLDGYEIFLRIIRKNQCLSIIRKSIRCLHLLQTSNRYQTLKTQLITNQTNQSQISFCHILRLFHREIQDIALNESIVNDIFCYLFDISSLDNWTDLAEPKYIQSFILFIHSFQFSNNKEQYITKIVTSISKSSSNFKGFFELKEWPFWLFMLGLSLGNEREAAMVFSIFLTSVFRIEIANSAKSWKFERFSCILRFLRFLNLIQIVFCVDIKHLTNSIFENLLNFALTEQNIGCNHFKLLISMMLKELFVHNEITYQKDLILIKPKDLYEYFVYEKSNETIDNQINSAFELQINTDNQSASLTQNYISSDMDSNLKEPARFEVNIINDTSNNHETNTRNDDFQIILLINQLIMTFISLYGNQSIVLFQDVSISTENLSSCINSLLNHSKCDNPIHAKIKDYSTYFKAELISLKNDICSKLQFLNKKTTLEKYMNYETKMSKNIESDVRNYDNFIESHERSCKILSIHNQKIATSFIHNVTSNGGPWQTNIKIPKWKYLSKSDGEGRNLYNKWNRNFTDHLDASAARDSTPFNPDIQFEKELSFKKVLNQNAAFVPESRNQIEAVSSFRVTYISLTKRNEGIIHVTQDKIIFEGTKTIHVFDSQNQNNDNFKIIELPIQNVGYIFKRQSLFKDVSVELFTNSYQSYLFNFSNIYRRNDFLIAVKKCYDSNHIKHNVVGFLKYFRKATDDCVQLNLTSGELLIKSKIIQKWQQKKISTFTYLYCLNILSSRSLNDLNQYPIFPWIISNYSTPFLNLNDCNNYRDLSKPIGALNEQRLEFLKRTMDEIQDSTQKCLYRSFFSSHSMVFNYLIRLEPFSTFHINLQDGKFDHPLRIFRSIEGAWRNVISTNNDFRELIPEFYCSNSFLVNENGFDLGSINQQKVNDVELPKWAKTSYEFISIQRIALESDYVSANIHHWIDLIFGCNQYSLEHDSIYHRYTYNPLSNINFCNENDDEVLRMNYMSDFGSFPVQLFSTNSPARNESSLPIQALKQLSKQFSPMQLINDNDVIEGRILLLKNNRILTTKYLDKKYQINLFTKNNELVNDELFALCHNRIIISHKRSPGIYVYDAENNLDLGHIMDKSCLVGSIASDNYYVVTGGSSCVIYVWDTKNMCLVDSYSLHSLPIVAIDCSIMLDVIVSLDEGYNVYIATLSNRKCMNTFKIDISLTENESIINESQEKKTTIDENKDSWLGEKKIDSLSNLSESKEIDHRNDNANTNPKSRRENNHASNRNMTKNLSMQRIESTYWAEETNEEDMFHENQQLLRIAPSGKNIIVTSFMTENKSFFDVYDMKGNRIKRLILHGKVIAMDVSGSSINGFEVVGLSFEKRTIMIIDLIFIKVIHTVKDPLMIPGFISVQIPADASSSLFEYIKEVEHHHVIKMIKLNLPDIIFPKLT